MTDALTLSDVLARGIAVEWHEAVAIVRAVADALSKSSEKKEAIPELHQVVIARSGDVDLNGGISGQDPVRRLGQLLQAMLNGSEPPVQLRLLISQATAPIPAYSSIPQFDDALGYFERPGRSAAIAGLCTRALEAPARLIEGARPTLDAIAPLPSAAQEDKQAQQQPATNRRNGRVALVVVALVLLAVSGGAFVIGARMPAGTSARLTVMAARGGAVLGASLVNGLSFVTERIGLGRLVSADERLPEPSEPRTEAAVTVIPAQRKAPRNSAAAAQLPQAIAASRPRTADPVNRNGASAAPAPIVPLPGHNTLFAAFDLEPRPAEPVERRTPEIETIVVSAARAPRYPPSSDDPTYASGADGVSPPVALRPQLPRELPPSVKRSDVRLIELVISPAGTVESVKLVGAPRNVHDSMLLSAVKAWEFVPAVKDGVPVRYRKTITVAPRD